MRTWLMKALAGWMMSFGLVAGLAHASTFKVEGAWMRQPMGKAPSAGYFTLSNVSKEPVTWTKAKSKDFARVELHETYQHSSGALGMRKLDELTLSPGAQLVFAPKGKHLMLFDPKRELKVGDTVEIELAGKKDGQSFHFSLKVQGLSGKGAKTLSSKHEGHSGSEHHQH